MKDILKHYSKYILLDTLVAATLFAGAHGILSLFHLKFIEWFYYAVIGSNGVQGVQTRLKRKDRFESK